MIKDPQEYLQHWEKINNPFYPKEWKWDRLTVNKFLTDYKQQSSLFAVVQVCDHEYIKENRFWLQCTKCPQRTRNFDE